MVQRSTVLAGASGFHCSVARFVLSVSIFLRLPPPAHAFISITSGERHSCAIDAAEDVVCWGENDVGQAPPVASSAKNFSFASTGNHHTCAIERGGGVVCFGSDSYGQSSPPAAASLSAVQLSLGIAHTCSVDAVGDAVCWGLNAFAQTTPPSHISTLKFSQISAGGTSRFDFLLLLKTMGTWSLLCF
jgi:alpha-tubulin suppressor-like RCC1 family protein|tara:strand:+ start:2147 stop:2710 length:564 start_codon:yes stop_codon:yes gene_type:complete